MKVWLITIGEPLPTDGGGDRLLRTGLLANLLVSKGHDVLWWTSSFDHARKQQRVEKDKVIDLSNSFQIYLMRSRGYGSNVSLGRTLDHWGLARKFAHLVKNQPPPDIIVAAMPTPGLSLAAVKYGLEKNVPVILDMRDMWPDVLVRALPEFAHGLGRLMLRPMAGTLKQACSQATSIIGITRPFVEWGLQYAGRSATALDRDFPLGYPQKISDKKAIEEAVQSWRQHGISEESDEFTACYFGMMSGLELETVIEAAKILDKDDTRAFRFILCGSGDDLERYKCMAKGLPRVIFPGWVNSAAIWTAMQMSSIGLAPYFSTKDFRASIPNKAIEYLSGSLPIISSLQGVLAELLSENNCGITYQNRDPEGLASVLRELYDNPVRLKEMSKNAYALFEERFVADKVYGEMVDYLEEVVRTYT